MSLWNDADKVGKELKEKREMEKMEEQAKEEAKEETKAEIEQHKKDKEQGML